MTAQIQGGISRVVGWKGGGGFRYFRLAPSLLEKDKWGNWVINKAYNAAMLAEAVCKLEGFVYAPSDTVYWQHGHSTERDFIYVTTQNLSHDQLQQLSDEVGEHRSLLVMCTAFRAKADRYPNLTIKKIPQAVLSRCEWGHDDYSLQVENLPKAPPKPGQLESGSSHQRKTADEPPSQRHRWPPELAATAAPFAGDSRPHHRDCAAAQREDLHAALATIRSEFPTVTDFEREFPSLCFALATGVGKTRLMGAFISYLHLAHGINNFFVLAPNLTIYNKLITDFTPNTPKYVFKGIAEFATDPPEIITGDNYESRPAPCSTSSSACKINIFNISKINSEVRGGRAPRIKRLSEYIGESYFDYLAGRDDLVLLMDESHRYRASAGVRAINELKPVLGLELTATPFVETSRGTMPFKNVIYDYPLAKAMADGFVKEPAVVTQKNFDPRQFTPAQLEEIKLQDGIRLHENTKVELETYARQTGQRIVKPFLLVIARDTAHASQLVQLIQSEQFFDGRYKDKVIQVDSSRTGAEEDVMVQRLLSVESPDEPTEIVVHVNMLKEGWDVTNLYTIVPLRAANARILIEQSIGRGLRLPYGKRTGVTAVDRLNIVAHDRFQEIIDEANKPDSVIQLQQVILDPTRDLQKMVTVISQSNIAEQLVTPLSTVASTHASAASSQPIFTNEAERKIAQATYEVIKQYEILPNSACLLYDDVQQKIVEEVAETVAPAQLELAGISAEAKYRLYRPQDHQSHRAADH